jgi:hypothetical protein
MHANTISRINNKNVSAIQMLSRLLFKVHQNGHRVKKSFNSRNQQPSRTNSAKNKRVNRRIRLNRKMKMSVEEEDLLPTNGSFYVEGMMDGGREDIMGMGGVLNIYCKF